MSGTLLRVWRQHCRDFRASKAGNVAIIFGLLLVPMTAGVGAAIDYTFAAKIRTKLQAAADAASIGSIAKSSDAYEAAATMLADGTIAAGATDAVKIFNAQLGNDTRFTLNNVSAVVRRASGEVTSTVEFSARVPTAIMGFFNNHSITITGVSKAAYALPKYIDFYVVLDNTPSMGVGATTTDINTMVANTPDQCAFACHDLSDPHNYYKKAKQLGVQMRIDVLRTATESLMDTAKDTRTVNGQFRMAIYTFGTSATSTGLRSVQNLTANLATAKASAKNIDLMTIPYQNYASDTTTNFGPILTGINTAISTPGSGAVSSAPQKFVFFVSDGVADRAVGSPACSRATTNGQDPQTGQAYVRCQEPLDVSYCTTLKNRGIKVAVLYTTYLPLPTNAWYNSWIAPFQTEIGTNMQTCASPGLFFEVSPSQGISEAMNALFQRAVAQARLVQ